jgi:membrane protein DedA with SNARE-associated domain
VGGSCGLTRRRGVGQYDRATNVDHFVAQYGYIAVFLLVFAESVGVPLPGETAVIAAGIYAGHTHSLSVWGIWLVAAAAAMAGGTVGFVIGTAGGYRLVRRYGPKIRLDEPKLKVGRYAFDRYGARIVFFGRFVSILRTYAALLAGTNRMPWVRFTIANTLGAILWAAIFTFSSYALGNAMRGWSTAVNFILIGIAVAIFVASILIVRRRTRELVEVAERAYPGPLE